MNQSVQKIGLFTATITCLNAMIGSGIFVAPATLATSVGPVGILTFLFVTIGVWCIGVSLARCAELYPQEGSFYTYTRPWAGHVGGLIASGSYLLGLIIAMGLISRMTGIYLHKYITIMPSLWLGVIVLILLTLLNQYGLTLSALGQQILIVTTTFPLIATTILCFRHASLQNIIPFAPQGWLALFKAARVVIFGFLGFEAAASLFPVVRDAEKNVPRALTYSVIIIGIIYMAFVGSIILATPHYLFSDPSIPLTSIFDVQFPHYPWIIFLIHISILSAMIGTIHSMIWSAGTLLTSLIKLSNARIVLTEPQSVGLIGFGILLSCITFSNLNLFFNLTAFFIMFPFCTSMMTLLLLPSEWKTGKNIRTLCGLATALAMVIFALQNILQ